MKPGQRGMTLFEFAVCVMIIGVLAAVLLNRLVYYQEMAEKAAMESTARLLKTGLQIRLAELIITNRQSEAAALEQENPVQWLETRPSNYGGLIHDDSRPGAWYFDERERQLVYVVNTGNRLDLGGETGPKQVRYSARLLRDRVRTAGGVVESVTGVTLVPVLPYRWP
ncbi:MAG TPA: prepilin-type N-terminal cleavage/methylation domain-containing protein [Burkholderiales bacterium]|nr:prepilin-type N-terminal cleavage/methylation domain-containing protein [Burkholderiales bacterium]